MQQLLSRVRRADEQYGLIKDGDVVAVGVSGGKDSLALMKLLSEYKRFSPGKFELMGVSIDLKFGGKETDFSPIENFAKEINVPYYIERTEIGQIVFDARKEKSPCACKGFRKLHIEHQTILRVLSGCYDRHQRNKQNWNQISLLPVCDQPPGQVLP